MKVDLAATVRDQRKNKAFSKVVKQQGVLASCAVIIRSMGSDL